MYVYDTGGPHSAPATRPFLIGGRIKSIEKSNDIEIRTSDLPALAWCLNQLRYRMPPEKPGIENIRSLNLAVVVLTTV
jgi:hypothetical protein